MLKMQDKELNIDDLIDAVGNFTKKNLFFILGFVVLGFVFGFYRFNKAENLNQTDVYAKSSFVPLNLIKNEISSINALLEENDFSKLSEELGLEESQLSAYSSMRYYEVSSDDQLFSFQIKSVGNENANLDFINAFTAYLAKNEYLANYLETERTQLAQNDEMYKKELLNLTAIQDGLLDQGGKGTYNILTNPSELSLSIISIRKSIISNQLLFDQVEVYSLIDVVDITTKPSLIKYLFTSTIVICFLGGFLLITFRLFWRKN